MLIKHYNTHFDLCKISPIFLISPSAKLLQVFGDSCHQGTFSVNAKIE